MKELLAFCQISRQAYHQNRVQAQQRIEKEHLLVGLMLQIREIHPAMGLRTMYEFYKPEHIGRDAFIRIGLKYGFRTKVFKNETRTTFSSPYSRYRNLLRDKVLDGVNQLWTSDLTYFKLGEVFYYLVFIMDVYSRKIIGFSVADNMRAENNCQALLMAFAERNQTHFAGLIHHSDRGGQYISDAYIQLLQEANICISMCHQVYENAHIERINGTIKNQYLIHWKITTFEQLGQALKRAVRTYNQDRPHSALAGRTPCSFEKDIKEQKHSERPKLTIWTCHEVQNFNPDQCLIPF